MKYKVILVSDIRVRYKFYFGGGRIQNGSWGGYRTYLLIQNIHDGVLIKAYKQKYSDEKEKVDFYWLDDSISKIGLGEESATIHWRNGGTSVEEMDISFGRYRPADYARFYNDFLDPCPGSPKT